MQTYQQLITANVMNLIRFGLRRSMKVYFRSENDGLPKGCDLCSARTKSVEALW